MVKFRMSLRYIVFVAFFWALPTATLCVLDNGKHADFIEVVRTYLLFIIGGFCFSLLTYPFFILERKKRETNTGMYLSESACADIYAGLKRLWLSRYFLVGVFCAITTIFLFREVFVKKLTPITAIAIRYTIAILIAFFAKYFIITVHCMMSKLTKQVEQMTPTHKAIGYFTYFLYALVLGVGFGTVEILMRKFVCNLPFKFAELTVIENICRTYGKNITYGCVFSVCIFLYRHKKEKTNHAPNVEIYV